MVTAYSLSSSVCFVVWCLTTWQRTYCQECSSEIRELCVFCLAGSSWPSLPHQICCLAVVLPNSCATVLQRLNHRNAHLFNWLQLSRQACHIEHWCVGQWGWMWLDMTLLACTYCARVHLLRRLPGDADMRMSFVQTRSNFIFWQVQLISYNKPLATFSKLAQLKGKFTLK